IFSLERFQALFSPVTSLIWPRFSPRLCVSAVKLVLSLLRVKKQFQAAANSRDAAFISTCTGRLLTLRLTMVWLEFQRMLGHFAGDITQEHTEVAQKRFKNKYSDFPIARSLACTEVRRSDHPITRWSGWLAASLLTIVLMGCAMGPAPPAVTPPNSAQGLSAVNHVIFIAQENRSFDTYFGHLNDYRMANGLPANVDGMPAAAANPADDGTMVTAFHLKTMCIENTSAAWATSHINFNRFNQASSLPTLDGFVVEAASAAKGSGANDVKGIRAMGF